eukprot:3787803-Pleurochrysis_carterae.AAC.1
MCARPRAPVRTPPLSSLLSSIAMLCFACTLAYSYDQTLAVTKGVFFPHSGAGPGCNSPMEFYAMLTDGLENLSGGMEMLWQLANYDFEGWLDGCKSSSFAYYK